MQGEEDKDGPITRGALLVVVDDVLGTGKTLCAVLPLVGKVGIGLKDISIKAPGHISDGSK